MAFQIVADYGDRQFNLRFGAAAPSLETFWLALTPHLPHKSRESLALRVTSIPGLASFILTEADWMRAIDTFNRYKEQPGETKIFRVSVSDMVDSSGGFDTPDHPDMPLYHSLNMNASPSASFGGFVRTTSFGSGGSSSSSSSSSFNSSFLSSSPPPPPPGFFSSSPPTTSLVPPHISVSPPPAPHAAPDTENGKPEAQEPPSPLRDAEGSSELAAVLREVASSQQQGLADRRQLVQLLDSWFNYVQRTGTQAIDSTTALHAELGSLRSEVAQLRSTAAPPSKDEFASSVLQVCREAFDERLASVQALHDAQLQRAEERASQAEERARTQLREFQNSVADQIRELTELSTQESRKNFEELRSCQALLGAEQKTTDRLQQELASLQQSVVTLQAELQASRLTVDGLAREVEQLRLQPAPPQPVVVPPPTPSIEKEKIGELDSRLRGLEDDARQNSAAFTQQLLDRIRELEGALHSQLLDLATQKVSAASTSQVRPTRKHRSPSPPLSDLHPQSTEPEPPSTTPASSPSPTLPSPQPVPIQIIPQPQPVPVQITQPQPQPQPLPIQITPQPQPTPQPVPIQIIPQPQPTPPPLTPPPEQPDSSTQLYPEQMELLFSMGFEDQAANLRALLQTNGNIEEASNILLNE